ncbi:MAG: 50S ribosomal protein L27 [Endomicrobia bacterium]|nr:50S ribosomal protein L27 [Endomicrobiia bacterium]MCX7941425.1 50S ribosomal protein L27 [Endomicrobiia bacterium]
MAHVTNGRDSNPKYLGVKSYEGELVKPGEIIVKQRGTKFLPGKNVFVSKDFSIHSKIFGRVMFKYVNKNKQRIDVEYINI